MFLKMPLDDREFRAGSQMLAMIRDAANRKHFKASDLIGITTETGERNRRQRLCGQVLHFLRNFGYLQPRPSHRPRRSDRNCSWVSEEARLHLQMQLEKTNCPLVKRWSNEASNSELSSLSDYSLSASRGFASIAPRDHGIDETETGQDLSELADERDIYGTRDQGQELKNSNLGAKSRPEIKRKKDET